MQPAAAHKQQDESDSEIARQLSAVVLAIGCTEGTALPVIRCQAVILRARFPSFFVLLSFSGLKDTQAIGAGARRFSAPVDQTDGALGRWRPW